MPVVTPEKLVALQRNSDDVRNICILAHVDHGKTSLTDALIATNGIISPKMAGKIRYLDSRPDEQLRGITMESSAISLCFTMARRASAESLPVQKDYLINLIDSPGHIDFSSEVSTASRLSDGALVLVDAVEGVCSQTVTVLRQTWIEKLRPILVINKMDRLVTELKMSAAEAYSHLSRLLEQVNAVLGSFFQGERMEDDLQWREKIEARVAAATSENAKDDSDMGTNGDKDHVDETDTYEERDDEALYFAPENNNVVFSSAIDGWAFSVGQFAALYEKKLGIKRAVLQKCLWGDFYLDPKTKRVLGSKHLKGRNLKPMFVQLVLENIWAVYQATTGGDHGKGDSALLEKITKSLSISIPPHVTRSRDPRALLTTVFAAWLPLSTAMLVTVIDRLPSPPVAQAARMAALIATSPGAEHVSPTIVQATTSFKSKSEDPKIAFISKMVSIPAKDLPQNKRKTGTSLTAEEAREMARKKRAEIAKAQAEAHAAQAPDGLDEISTAMGGASIGAIGEDEIEESNGGGEEGGEEEDEPEQLIGFARLYSGNLTVGDEVYVLPPKFTPADAHRSPEPRKVKLTSLYLLMGRSLEALQSVPAGVVFGIGGLEGHVLKSGTICSQLEGAVNLAGVSMGGDPIVRVALEPANPGDLDKMIQGMKLLEQSDPCAAYEVLESGEHVILTAGELHLERCLKDLRERFARCEIQAGEPIVPYRESIVNAAEMNEPKNKDLPRGTVIGITTSKQVSVRLRVRPLPQPLTEFLISRKNAIRHLYAKQKEQEGILGEDEDIENVVAESIAIEQEVSPEELLSLEDLRKGMKSTLEGSREQKAAWSKAIDQISAFGPRRSGPNLLVDSTSSQIFENFLDKSAEGGDPENVSGQNGMTRAVGANDFVDRITYSFQLAMAQGPLCLEPIQGVAVFVEDVSVAKVEDIEGLANENVGRLTGEVIKTVRDSIRQGFMDWSPRLLLAMYSCEIQASTEVLGRVYPTITRRRGRILSEEMKEGTPFFTITAVLPVATSFGFADDIRKKTSGGAQPQLRFAGFEMLDEDPMWVPFTEEELEDLGTTADRENVAKVFMDGVRRRKGLVISGLKREGGEKARTLKR